ncbi:hypothetical protein [Streptomyces badius]
MALALFGTPGTALVGRGLLDLLPDFDRRQVPGTATGLAAGPASGSAGTGTWMRAGAGAGACRDPAR